MTNSFVTTFRLAGFRRRFVVALIVGLVAVSACSTTSPQLPERGLEGALDEDAFWEEWTPRQPVSMPVDERLEPVTVFAAWSVEDPQFRKQAWDSLFHGLTALHVALDDDSAARVVQSLMMRLDARLHSASWELAFVSHGHGEHEGLVIRLVGEDGAGIWLEALRSTGAAQSPEWWTLRVEPAVEERPGLTVHWEADGTDWRVYRASGAEATDPTEKLSGQVEWSDIIGLWETDLWHRVSGANHVDPNFEYTAEVDRPLADGWPPALGREVRERGLEDFVTDTVFPPAGDIEFEGGE